MLHTIGTELISSESVAVVELVKNAYDADAKRVVLSFSEDLREGNGTLTVLDDGSGMTADIIREVWLVIATPHRVGSRRTHGGRRVLGEKGIGRFAVARLADSMTLISRTAGSPDEVIINVDWRQFRNPELFLDEVELQVQEAPADDFVGNGRVTAAWRHVALEPSLQGTMLILRGMTRTWDAEDFNSLRRDLSRLIAPSDDSGVRDFEIVLDLPGDYEHLAGPVEPPTELTNPPYRLTGRVTEDGFVHATITVPGSPPHDVVVPIDEARHHRNEDGVLASGPFSVDFRVYDRDPAAIAALTSDSSLSLTTKQFRDLLDQRAGVSVYRDGFRVLPFGERGDDWLNLDARRVNNPAMRLSNSQMIGTIRITSDKNPDLRDQTNREGLLQGRAHDALRAAVTEVVALLERERFAQRKPEQTPLSPKGRGLFDDISINDVADAVQRTHPEDRALAAVVADAQKRLNAGVERVREVLSRYQRLATLGRLVDEVVHDGQSSVGRIRRATRDAEELVEETVSCPQHARSKNLVEAVDKQADYLAHLFKRIAPFGGRRRGRPATLRMQETLRDGVDVLASTVAKVGADITFSGTDEQVTLDPVELQEVIVNLLDNSLYWLQNVPEGSRRIDIRTDRLSDGGLELIVDDSGPGVPEDIREAIFEPYFTSKPDGGGLGLSIVGERVADAYGGELELVESQLGGAAFRVIFRRRV
jgi:signal transduction histidine kinase